MKKPRLFAVLLAICLTAVSGWMWWSGWFFNRSETGKNASGVPSEVPWSSAAKTNNASQGAGEVPPTPEIPDPVRTRPAIETAYTLEKLSADHERAPNEHEWPELTRILFDGEDGPLVEAVKARFMVYARENELSAMADEYDNPRDIGVKQRIIDIFSGLQSDAGLAGARQVLTDEGMPPSDALVSASAVALARKGNEADLKYIVGRLDQINGESPEDEAAADGLIYALSESRDPRTALFLQDAAAGRGEAKSWRSRLAAIQALQNHPSPAAVEILEHIAKEDADTRLKEQAARMASELRAAAAQTPDTEVTE